MESFINPPVVKPARSLGCKLSRLVNVVGKSVLRISNQSCRGTAGAIILTLFTCIVVHHPVDAHEFWLEPTDYSPKTGATIAVSIKNGQFFKGNSLPFIRAWFSRFVIEDSRGVRSVESVDGNDPAALLQLAVPGLAIIAYESKDYQATFATLQEFTKYLKREGLAHILPRHLARGLGKSATRETYLRCAKLLLSAGRGGGKDRAIGLTFELIAERNPYSLSAGTDLPVRLLLRGKPATGITVRLFDQEHPREPRDYVTDRNGRVRIAVSAGRKYLLNAVYMYEPENTGEVDWSSYWASLTFAVGSGE